MIDYAQYVGLGAGAFTGFSLVPQLFKIIREKEAENISYFMLGILLTGLAGWIWYGILKEDLPILITNSFSFVVNVIIIILSAKYKK